MPSTLTGTLEPWSNIAGDDWPTLVVGNGLSMTLWAGFSYSRLLDQANLGAVAQQIFAELRTTNFERVLEALLHAKLVTTALEKPTRSIDRVYRSVRRSLFDTLRQVHVPWSLIPTATLNHIAEALDAYQHVFTVNYDLIPYWALMETPNTRIADFFWSDHHTFDPERVEVFAGYSALYYLHGGVHLWQSDRTGQTGKWTSGGQGLLRLGTLYGRHPDRRPLFVSEGTAPAKRRTIRRSDYLSFALNRLREEESNTVLFGLGLSSQDDHIAAAIRKGSRRRVAVALRPGPRSMVLGRKGFYVDRLGNHRVLFFDATTHPLGVPALVVASP